MQASEFKTEPALTCKGNTYGFSVYVTRRMIEKQVKSLAAELQRRFPEKDKPLFCPILNGAAFFYHDLARALRRPETERRIDPEGAFPHEVAYVHARRYGLSTQGSKEVEISWFGFDKIDIHGRTVLLIDDILDEGLTATTVAAGLRARGSANIISLFACRKVPSKSDFHADYVMFDVPAHTWCVGYGMDLKNQLRNVLMIVDATDMLTPPTQARTAPTKAR